MALQLVRRGCLLALVDVAREANEQTASLVRAAAAAGEAADSQLQVRAYAADLSQSDHIQRLVQQVLQDFGRIDVLVTTPPPPQPVRGRASAEHALSSIASRRRQALR